MLKTLTEMKTKKKRKNTAQALCILREPTNIARISFAFRHWNRYISRKRVTMRMFFFFQD